mmetsp:Transcript_16912/g.24463  ORF Transcript_16912/g.24463 Transcript_16912/m.24463 type:complete len:251 (+) Transcript_16912:159-911(+)
MNYAKLFAVFPAVALSFQNGLPSKHSPSNYHSSMKLLDKNSPVEEYRNTATSMLSNFMQKEKMTEDPLKLIDFDSPKVRKMPIEKLASKLDLELYEKEWFVTGNVNPSYFSDDFKFEDPDVKLSGIEDYARGVYKLFDQETSRAEIISTEPTSEDTITVTWRLSGKVNIGPGLPIKPYICYSDLKVDSDGLVCFQEDRFDIPGWDILISALFPFLIGKITSPPAPPVKPRVFESSRKESPLDKLFEIFQR